MNFISSVRLAIIFATIAAASTFIVSFSACGILSNNAIAYAFGVLNFLLILYYVYFMYKLTNPSIANVYASPILIVIIITFVLTGGITTFIRTKNLYTSYSNSAKFAYVLMITLGLASTISFVTPNILIKLFKGSEIIPDVILNEPNFLLLIFTITNLACEVFTSLILVLRKINSLANEDMVLKDNCIYSIISVFFGAIFGAFVGIIVEFRAESYNYRADDI